MVATRYVVICQEATKAKLVITGAMKTVPTSVNIYGLKRILLDSTGIVEYRDCGMEPPMEPMSNSGNSQKWIWDLLQTLYVF